VIYIYFTTYPCVLVFCDLVSVLSSLVAGSLKLLQYSGSLITYTKYVGNRNLFLVSKFRCSAWYVLSFGWFPVLSFICRRSVGPCKTGYMERLIRKPIEVEMHSRNINKKVAWIFVNPGSPFFTHLNKSDSHLKPNSLISTTPWLPFLPPTQRRFSLTYVLLAPDLGVFALHSLFLYSDTPGPPSIRSGYFRAKTFPV